MLAMRVLLTFLSVLSVNGNPIRVIVGLTVIIYCGMALTDLYTHRPFTKQYVVNTFLCGISATLSLVLFNLAGNSTDEIIALAFTPLLGYYTLFMLKRITSPSRRDSKHHLVQIKGVVWQAGR